MCWDSFFNSPRHSGSNVGNKHVILYTKSHQAGGGRERIVRERNNVVYFITSCKIAFPFKAVHLVRVFTVKIPGSRDRKRHLKKSLNNIESRDFSRLTTTWPRTVLVMLACSPEGHQLQPQVGLMRRSSATRCQCPIPVTCPPPHCGNVVKNLYQVPSKTDVFRDSLTNPDAIRLKQLPPDLSEQLLWHSGS